jgi:hypothetical protein
MRIAIFGGQSENKLLANLAFFDTVTAEWTFSEATGGPVPRVGHSLASAGDKLVVHGGRDGPRVFGDVFVFESGAWREVQVQAGIPGRYGHISIPVSGQLVLFGGAVEEGTPARNIALNLRNWTWKEYESGGNCHALLDFGGVLADDGTIVVYGGTEVGSKQARNSVFAVVLPVELLATTERKRRHRTKKPRKSRGSVEPPPDGGVVLEIDAEEMRREEEERLKEKEAQRIAKENARDNEMKEQTRRISEQVRLAKEARKSRKGEMTLGPSGSDIERICRLTQPKDAAIPPSLIWYVPILCVIWMLFTLFFGRK